jgi:hypothetical protein
LNFAWNACEQTGVPEKHWSEASEKDAVKTDAVVELPPPGSSFSAQAMLRATRALRRIVVVESVLAAKTRHDLRAQEAQQS